MLVIDRENDCILLGTRPKVISRVWSCLAGFAEVRVLTIFKESSSSRDLGTREFPCCVLVLVFIFSLSPCI